MPAELHHDTVFLLRDIVTLANIVERVKFHHQMVHAAAWPLSNGQAVVSAVDVHKIQRHRGAHEVGYPEAQQVPIECKGRVDFRHYQHGMSHALRPSTKARYMPCRAERFIGDLTTVERLYTITGRVAERNHLSSAALIRHGGGFPLHRAASASSAVAFATSQPKKRSPSVKPPSTIRRCFRSSMRNARMLPPRSTACSPNWPIAKLLQSSSFEVPTQK